jgi:hypothetical protein
MHPGQGRQRCLNRSVIGARSSTGLRRSPIAGPLPSFLPCVRMSSRSVSPTISLTVEFRFRRSADAEAWGNFGQQPSLRWPRLPRPCHPPALETRLSRMGSTARLRKSVKWRTDGMKAYAGALRATSGWDRHQRVQLQLSDSTRQPVILCTWRRLERLSSTLRMLAAQDIPAQALIWNNSPNCEAVNDAALTAPLPVAVYHSDRNIGGFGRFYLAREVATIGHNRVVFVDDDQDFAPGMLAALLGSCPERTISGWWAWRFAAPRYPPLEPAAAGERAQYVGTGGMAADAALFRAPAVFACPRRFWFAEDLWLSYAAWCEGYDLRKSAAVLRMGDDGRNQFPSLGYVKQHLVRCLVRRGWDITRDSIHSRASRR